MKSAEEWADDLDTCHHGTEEEGWDCVECVEKVIAAAQQEAREEALEEAAEFIAEPDPGDDADTTALCLGLADCIRMLK